MKRILVPVISLSVVMLILMAGSAAVTPILPDYARNFGVSITIVGLVLATNNTLRMLFGFPAGAWIDRWGRKPFIILGMLITASGAAVAWAAADIGTLFIGQALIGIGAALYSTAALAMVVDLADETNRSKVTGLYMMGFHLGTVFGPGVGGWLAYRYATNSPFLLYGILAAMAGFATVFLTRETHPDRGPVVPNVVKKAIGSGVNWRQALTRDLEVVYFVNFAFRFGFNGLMLTILPLMISEQHFDSRTTGLIFMMLGGVSMLTFFPSGALADRVGRRNVLLPGGLMLTLSFFLFQWAKTLPLIFATSAFLGVSGGAIATIPAALVGDLAPEAIRGTAMGFFRSIGDLGLALSPATMGFVGDHWGLTATFRVAFVLWVIVSATLFLLPKGDRRPVLAEREAAEPSVT